MSEFTPGPWGQMDAMGITIITKAGGGVAIAQIVNYREDIDRANARLIVAAPDLLHALQLMANAFPLPDDSRDAVDAKCYAHDYASAAIAKATGEA